MEITVQCAVNDARMIRQLAVQREKILVLREQAPPESAGTGKHFGVRDASTCISQILGSQNVVSHLAKNEHGRQWEVFVGIELRHGSALITRRRFLRFRRQWLACWLLRSAKRQPDPAP